MVRVGGGGKLEGEKPKAICRDRVPRGASGEVRRTRAATAEHVLHAQHQAQQRLGNHCVNVTKILTLVLLWPYFTDVEIEVQRGLTLA